MLGLSPFMLTAWKRSKLIFFEPWPVERQAALWERLQATSRNVTDVDATMHSLTWNGLTRSSSACAKRTALCCKSWRTV